MACAIVIHRLPASHRPPPAARQADVQTPTTVGKYLAMPKANLMLWACWLLEFTLFTPTYINPTYLTPAL